MRLPRNLSGKDLAVKLQDFGYVPSRQTGSHLRLTRTAPQGAHHVTIPKHRSFRAGTLNTILSEISGHLQISKAELIKHISQ